MKKTVKEMIEVMQAYADGKKIEFGSDNPIASTKWKEAVNPTWDWDNFDYRVKPEPHYVPYDSVDEADREKMVRQKIIVKNSSLSCMTTKKTKCFQLVGTH